MPGAGETLIPQRKYRSLSRLAPEKAAAAVDLVYVTDARPGITRIRKGRQFSYINNKSTIRDKKVLQRIKSLVLPPAWENVWICTLHNGHLQATGTDTRQRKQYKYHPQWIALRNSTKFYRMLDFGKALPSIRRRVAADLALPGLPAQKVLALVVALMENTGIRVGSGFYEKLYGSFGLTTLKDKHVTIGGGKVKFIFTGKKGVKHSITLKNRKLAAIVKQCRDIPGKDLFQYYEDNEHKTIDSGMVNAYIKEISGTDFTAKDFRTWNGTVSAFCALCGLGCAKDKKELQKNIVEALNIVAKQLGNTRAVCKKYYVHPAIITLYESDNFEPYIKKLRASNGTENDAGLEAGEKIILDILKLPL
jgi:DNA topoisomerase-1